MLTGYKHSCTNLILAWLGGSAYSKCASVEAKNSKVIYLHVVLSFADFQGQKLLCGMPECDYANFVPKMTSTNGQPGRNLS